MLVGERFKPYIIKPGEEWDLILHEDQSCVGRALLWYRGQDDHDGENLNVDSLSPKHWRKIQQIARDLRKKAWRALGHKVDLSPREGFLDTLKIERNLIDQHRGHMHVHLTPRFKEPLFIIPLQLEFRDLMWGTAEKNTYRTLEPAQMLAIRQIMATAIG